MVKGKAVLFKRRQQYLCYRKYPDADEEQPEKQETLFANSYYQTCLLSTRLDPIVGYVGLASYNEPNLTVEKTYTDSGNNQITAAELNTLLGKTTFVVSCLYDGKSIMFRQTKTVQELDMFFKVCDFCQRGYKV